VELLPQDLLQEVDGNVVTWLHDGLQLLENQTRQSADLLHWYNAGDIAYAMLQLCYCRTLGELLSELLDLCNTRMVADLLAHTPGSLRDEGCVGILGELELSLENGPHHHHHLHSFLEIISYLRALNGLDYVKPVMRS